MTANKTNATILRFGVFEANLQTGELRKRGMRLKLQGQPFQILALLLERPGELVSREELRQQLWPADTFVDFDHGLNSAVKKLREALSDSASSPRFVETLAKRGYRFIAPVDSATSQEPAATNEAEVEAEVEVEAEINESKVEGLPVPPVPLPAIPAPRTAAASPPRSLDGDTEPPSGTYQETLSAARSELPKLSRRTARINFGLLQLMYLSFYTAALATLHLFPALPGDYGFALMAAIPISALVGIPLRLYCLTAVSLDYHLLGEKYRLLWPFLFALDLAWALCPLLLEPKIGFGLALAAVAPLLYSPFAQRVLIHSAYPLRGK